jgi:threonine dehydrogenase-like Zn-dependent dehydrogenase
MQVLLHPRRRRLEVAEVAVPDPAPGEALVRVRYCGICGSDLSVFESGALAGPGVVLGHEVVGTVEVDTTGTHSPGSRVVIYPPVGCGTCHWCRAGHPRHCLDPRVPLGGFAQYVAVPAAHLVPVPDEIGDETAALADPVGVAVRAVRLAGPPRGSPVFVSGLGPIGLCVVSVLAERGCRVVATEPNPARARMGERLGAEAVIDPGAEDVYEAGRDLDPAGFRCAFECSGVPEALQQIFDVCGPLGTVMVLGIPKEPVLLLRVTTREQTVRSISGPDLTSMAHALHHLNRHRELAAIVSDVVGLEEAERVFAELIREPSDRIKVLIDPHRDRGRSVFDVEFRQAIL